MDFEENVSMELGVYECSWANNLGKRNYDGAIEQNGVAFCYYFAMNTYCCTRFVGAPSIPQFLCVKERDESTRIPPMDVGENQPPADR